VRTPLFPSFRRVFRGFSSGQCPILLRRLAAESRRSAAVVNTALHDADYFLDITVYAMSACEQSA
jgi:hypothetical protein